MAKLKDIILTIQSFRDAGGLDVFPHLEIRSTLRAHGDSWENDQGMEEINKQSALEEANKDLREKAKRGGYTAVFGIVYNFSKRGCGVCFECEAIGTGYKPKANWLVHSDSGQ